MVAAKLTASAVEVVGRRTPCSAIVLSARRLSSEDLPEPVAPAKATTVCVPADSRASACRAMRVARRLVSDGNRSPASANTSPRASRRSANVVINAPPGG